MTRANLLPQRLARTGGLLYLLIIVFGVAGEAAIRGRLIASDAGQTAANVLSAELWFRLSILGDVLMVLADVALGVVLCALLSPVDRVLSIAAMAFRLAQAAVLGLNLVHLEQAVTLAHDAALHAPTRDQLVVAALDAHAAGYDLGLFFFAVSCLLVGYLLARSRLVPRVIAVGSVAAGLVYAVGSTLRLVAPDLSVAFAPAYGIPLAAEVAMCGWLLVKGVDGARWSGALGSVAQGQRTSRDP